MGNRFPVPHEGSSPLPFGRDQSTVRKIRFDLSAARSNEEINLTGNVFWVIAASALGELAQVSFNEVFSGGDALPVGQGLYISGIKFSKIYLTNTAQAGAYIDVVYTVTGSQELTINNPLDDAAANVIVDAGEAIASGAFISTAAAAVTLISAANTNRKRITVSSLSTNTANIQIGPITIGAANGYILEPGDSFTLDTEAALYYYTATAAQTLSFIEERKV